MTLVDTSVWIDHFRKQNIGLVELLERYAVLMHPFVVGELALGNFSSRATVVSALRDLPRPAVASHEEVLGLIETQGLFGIGIGYVDAHLLAAVRLTPGSSLWTLDKRLAAVAARVY